VSTSTFVAMERRSALWGIHAQIVQAVVADREWNGAEPFDMSAALGIAPPPPDSGHPILLVGAAENASPIRALGAVVLRQVEVSSVWPVPQLARSPGHRQTVSGVAFLEGHLPLLVLDPIALLAMAKEHGKP
jgi:hypothetical protein